MAEDVSAEVSWNASYGLIAQISNLLDLGNKRYLAGKPKEEFFILKAIKKRVIQSLKPEERKDLSDKEEEITSILDSTNLEEKKKIHKLVEEYNEKLMDYLDYYGYLIQKKTDMGRMF